MGATSALLQHPDHVVQEATTIGVAPYEKYAHVPWWDFLANRRIVVPGRPRRSALDTATAKGYDAAIRRLAHTLHGAEDHYFQHVMDADEIRRVYHHTQEERDPVNLEKTRKALRWHLAWRGVPKNGLPDFLQHKWDPHDLVVLAQRDGRMKQHAKRFELTHVESLLTSTPFTRKGQASKMWGRDEATLSAWCRRYRQECAYLDATFRAMTLVMTHTGRRVEDLRELRLRHIVFGDGARFVAWPDMKKGGEPVDTSIPEGYVFRELDEYVRKWRPMFITDVDAASDFVFLTTRGTPSALERTRMFVSEGVHLTLGPNVPAAHGLRRFMATIRHQNGWPIADIALLMNDTTEVVESTYIDRAWVRAHKRLLPEDNARPMTPNLDPKVLMTTRTPPSADFADAETRERARRGPHAGRATESAAGDSEDATEQASSPSSFDPLAQPWHHPGGALA